LAEPTSVPAGVYSKKFFERVGIWDALVKGAPQEAAEAAEVVALADEVILLESGRMRARGVPRDLKPEASGSPGRSRP